MAYVNCSSLALIKKRAVCQSHIPEKKKSMNTLPSYCLHWGVILLHI